MMSLSSLSLPFVELLCSNSLPPTAATEMTLAKERMRLMGEFNLVSKGFIERMEKNKKVIEVLRGD
jgi:hypothetical protein